MAAELNSVESCKGWTTSCNFCNKRLGEWQETEDDETLQAIPDKSVIFMFAFNNKQGKEIVIIGYSATKAQRTITNDLQTLRERISQKKFKETKSNILLRYAHFPEPNSKDVSTLFAHWINYSILPRLSTEWPGESILKSTKHYQFSNLNMKWCHIPKDAVWRKPKTLPPTKAVKRCKWNDSCTFCEGRFTQWWSIMEAVDKKIVPESSGFVLYSLKQQNRFKTFFVTACQNLRSQVKHSCHFDRIINERIVRTFSDRSQIFVKWIVQELQSVESCFMYAHFLNAVDVPEIKSKELLMDWPIKLGEELLTASEAFTFRDRDNQWCYQSESVIQSVKYNKNKEKRLMRQSIEEELLDDD